MYALRRPYQLAKFCVMPWFCLTPEAFLLIIEESPVVETHCQGQCPTANLRTQHNLRIRADSGLVQVAASEYVPVLNNKTAQLQCCCSRAAGNNASRARRCQVQDGSVRARWACLQQRVCTLCACACRATGTSACARHLSARACVCVQQQHNIESTKLNQQPVRVRELVVFVLSGQQGSGQQSGYPAVSRPCLLQQGRHRARVLPACVLVCASCLQQQEKSRSECACVLVAQLKIPTIRDLELPVEQHDR